MSTNMVTILNWAVAKEYSSVVEKLLERGADLLTQKETRFAALYHAAKRGYGVIVQMPLNAGMSPDGLQEGWYYHSMLLLASEGPWPGNPAAAGGRG